MKQEHDFSTQFAIGKASTCWDHVNFTKQNVEACASRLRSIEISYLFNEKCWAKGRTQGRWMSMKTNHIRKTHPGQLSLGGWAYKIILKKEIWNKIMAAGLAIFLKNYWNNSTVRNSLNWVKNLKQSTTSYIWKTSIQSIVICYRK